MKKTPTGKLSKQERIKSARDAVLIGLGALLPQLLEILTSVDFGEYSGMVSIVVAMLAPLVNRLLNIKRI